MIRADVTMPLVCRKDLQRMIPHMVLDLGNDCLLLGAQLHNAGGLQRDLIVMAGVVEGLQTQAKAST